MISVNGLTKRFGRTVALDSMSLDVEKGMVYGLIGPNGAGKTTIMSILATLQLPDSGSATIDGLDVTGHIEEIRSRVGYMPDFFGVYDGLMVCEYLDFFARSYYLPEKGRSLIDSLLELVSLEDKKHSYVDLLSRGMKQRLALARCLVHDPVALILDEPASGLDPRSRAEMKDIIRQLGRMGKTILISSHILPELGEICDRVAIMEGGRVITSGSVDEITAMGSGSRLIAIEVAEGAGTLAGKLGGSENIKLVDWDDSTVRILFRGNRDDQALLLREIIAGGYTVIQYQEVRRNLEEAFMAVTGEVTGK